MSAQRKRDLSIVALIKTLAAENVAVTVTLPNGTTIQTLTPPPGSASIGGDGEAPVKHGAFKKVREPRAL